MKTAVQKVKTSQLYAKSFKNEMEVYSFEELEEDTVEFAKLASLYLMGIRRMATLKSIMPNTMPKFL